MSQAKTKTKQTIRARDHRGRAVRTPASVEQDLRAAELRSKSLSYRQIGTELGMNVSSAFQAVQRGIREIPTEGATEARRIELAKLDTVEQAAWSVLEALHFVLVMSGPNAGDIVYHPEKPGEPLTDPTPVLAAIDSIRKTSERRSKLLGLDAPQRRVLEVIDDSSVDREIERLVARLAENDDPEGVGDRSEPSEARAIS
jgi:hypothetical protein